MLKSRSRPHKALAACTSPSARRASSQKILAGQITVPVAAVFPVEQIRDAVALQAGRHVHGKVVVTL